MTTDKTFTVAGTSKLNGEVKVRFANDVMRIKVLAKHGHSDIILIELPTAMSKIDAAEFLKTLDEFQGVAEQSAIGDLLDRKEVKPASVKTPVVKTPTVKAVKAKAVKAKAVKIDTSEMEDAPF